MQHYCVLAKNIEWQLNLLGDLESKNERTCLCEVIPLIPPHIRCFRTLYRTTPVESEKGTIDNFNSSFLSKSDICNVPPNGFVLVSCLEHSVFHFGFIFAVVVVRTRRETFCYQAKNKTKYKI